MKTCLWCGQPLLFCPAALETPPAGLAALRRFAAEVYPRLGHIAPADGWVVASHICEECWWPIVALGERVNQECSTSFSPS